MADSAAVSLAEKVPHSQNIRVFFHLFGEDGWHNLYAGALEERPPGAPTTQSKWWLDHGGKR
jgi:hypothetical protein